MDKEKTTAGKPKGRLVPVLISGFASAVLLELGGLFGFFFPVPIGIMVFAYNTKMALFAACTALVSHIGVFFALSLLSEGSHLIAWYLFGWSASGVGVILLLWIWSVSPSSLIGGISTANRFMISAVLVFVFILYGIFMADRANMRHILLTQVKTSVKAAFSAYSEYGGSDIGETDIASIIKTGLDFLLKGGGLAFIILFFFLNRQISASLASMFKHSPKIAGIASFYTDRRLVWGLSFSILAVVYFKQSAMVEAEIIAWNALTICAILYFGQGVGIIFYFLSKSPRTALTRLVQSLLIAVILITPGVNLLVCGGALILGVAENWVPFRNQDIDGSSSTPVM